MKLHEEPICALAGAALNLGRAPAFLFAAIARIFIQSGAKPLNPIPHGISRSGNMPFIRLSLAGSCPAGPQETEYISRSFLFRDKRLNAEPDTDGRARANRDTVSKDVFLINITGFEPYRLNHLPLYRPRPAGYQMA